MERSGRKIVATAELLYLYILVFTFSSHFVVGSIHWARSGGAAGPWPALHQCHSNAIIFASESVGLIFFRVFTNSNKISFIVNILPIPLTVDWTSPLR